ncbi:MAG: glycosyltransferase [Gammaproteobacteria bacterium]
MSKRIVITCWGSHGDLFPYIGLALALKERGHAPVIATMPLYQSNVEQEGLDYAAVGPTVDVTDLRLFERIMDPRRGSEVIIREMLLPKLRETYEQLQRAAAGADFVVSHPICYATPVFAERERLPWVSTTLAPMLFFSRSDPAVMPMLPRLNSIPLIGKWLAGKAPVLMRGITREWMKPVAALRAELGMAPGAHPLFEGQYSPLGTLAMYSRVLATPQHDWPPNVMSTGCVFYNGPEGLDAKLEAFLADGPPPVVFTLGTSAVGAAGRFYHESSAAAQKLGMRAVLLTGGLEQNKPTGPLPDSVLLVDRAPHQLLFPRAAAVVHQVGAGTLGQALRSGKPMLTVPHGHDQFDNAFRVTKLGVARTVFPKDYTAARVARELTLLLDAGYRRRAEEVAAVVRQEGGADAAAAAIEQYLR